MSPTKPTGGDAASVLVAALERAWSAIRRRHPEVPEVVMAVASGSVGRRGELKLGHFAERRWTVDAAERPELFVGGEGLAAGAVEVLGTLLHEGPPTAWPPPAASRTPAARAATTTAATPPSPASSA
jgi:hypothetical protein